MPSLSHRWRPLITVLVYAFLTLALTWPTAAHLTDGWLADSTNDPDAFLKLWDIDYLGRMFRGEPEQTFFHTSLLFHPEGLDLTYHTFHVPHMLTAYALRPFLGLIGAYNATSLLLVFFTALSGYVLLRALLPRRNRWSSWGSALLGGAVFGFSQWVLYNLRHPDLAFLATQALAILFTVRLIRRRQIFDALLAGLMIGLTAYIGLYILVVTGLMLGTVVLIALIRRRGRLPWGGFALLAVVAAALAAPRLVPMVSGNLGFALTAKYSEYHAWESVDLVNYFIPDNHPFFGRYFDVPKGAERYHMFYLGWSVIALSFVGLLRRNTRRYAALGIVGALFFMWLALGPKLNVNGSTSETFPMLKPLLDHVPVVFKAFGRPDNFLVGVTLCVALAAAFGMYSLLSFVRRYGIVVQMIVVALVLLFVCWERWAGEYDGSYPERGQSPYYAQLAQEAGDFAILELPLGRNPGKFYLFYQLTHGKPMVEGLASRTPDGAYDYIAASDLLNAWRYWRTLDCSTIDLAAEYANLAADDVRYIILHRNDPPLKILQPYFAGVTPIYEDNQQWVYRTEDLIAGPMCP